MNPTSNSTSSANENCRPLIGDPSTVKAVKILAYCFVLIVSLLGNSAIISIVRRNNRMRTTVNCLIANMAASDLLISTVAVPMKLCEIAIGPRRWLIEGTFCNRISASAIKNLHYENHLKILSKLNHRQSKLQLWPYSVIAVIAKI